MVLIQSSLHRCIKCVSAEIIYMYIFTQLLCLRQEVTQSQSFGRVKLVWIQSFSSHRLGIELGSSITFPRLITITLSAPSLEIVSLGVPLSSQMNIFEIMVQIIFNFINTMSEGHGSLSFIIFLDHVLRTSINLMKENTFTHKKKTLLHTKRQTKPRTNLYRGRLRSWHKASGKYIYPSRITAAEPGAGSRWHWPPC